MFYVENRKISDFGIRNKARDKAWIFSWFLNVLKFKRKYCKHYVESLINIYIVMYALFKAKKLFYTSYTLYKLNKSKAVILNNSSSIISLNCEIILSLALSLFLSWHIKHLEQVR